MKRFLLLLFSCLSLTFYAQVKTVKVAKKLGTVNLSQVEEDWYVNLIKKEAPYPQGETYQAYLNQKKEALELKYAKSNGDVKSYATAVDTPIVLKSYIGNPYGGGIPNDNSIAISNDGILMSANNSLIWVWDTNNDSIILKRSFSGFITEMGIEGNKYDPKLKYDHEQDRFIVVFLNGTSDTNSKIIVAFSATNDPTGDWNLYALEGNPLNNGTWTDYPALGLTKDDFFITGNLIQTGVSWQEGFRGSIIWQIDKMSGFNGEDLRANLWSDIKFNDAWIRNIHPISGGDDLKGPEMYFLSNRNFDESNDTIFVVNINDNFDNATELTVNYGITNQPYGLPINGRQQGEHRLATNDARVLGGFLENDQIQFVANTIDPNTGNAAVYHGFIQDYDTEPSITGVILGDSTDWGYPNIAYTGRYEGDNEAIINFNFVHPEIYSSCAIMFYDGNGGYSTKNVTRDGETYVNMMGGNVERWGDYSGIQKKFNEPGMVWCTGTYGRTVSIGLSSYKSNQTFLTQVMSPDTTELSDLIPSALDFSLYPNPTVDLMTLEIDLPVGQDIAIQIFDINGREVVSLLKDYVNAGVYDLQFNTYHLAKGAYVIRVMGGDEMLMSETFTKF